MDIDIIKSIDMNPMRVVSIRKVQRKMPGLRPIEDKLFQFKDKLHIAWDRSVDGSMYSDEFNIVIMRTEDVLNGQ